MLSHVNLKGKQGQANTILNSTYKSSQSAWDSR